MNQKDIDADDNLSDTGMDSTTGVEWIHEINERYRTSITASRIYDYPTIREFAGFLATQLNKREEVKIEASFQTTPILSVLEQSLNIPSFRLPEKQLNSIRSSRRFWPKQSIPTTWPQFPELIHLNHSYQGRPIFWFHAGAGGVGEYRVIAKNIHRPFYGIEPRGQINNRLPLQGIPAMAAYYTHIIQSVQPEGPYDLGGYSIAGRLSYEVTRQLQELGQAVNTIVMLDSLYESKRKLSGRKGLYLQQVNMLLLAKNQHDPEKITQTLIHRDEVNLTLEDEEFIKQLIKIARTRGLHMTEDLLHAHIQRNMKIFQAFKLGQFSFEPLPDPQAVTCYYFRNKNGLFFGNLKPYFTTRHDDDPNENINYWDGWKLHLPVFHMMDVDASNHMMVLSEPKACATILSFCEKLYSQ